MSKSNNSKISTIEDLINRGNFKGARETLNKINTESLNEEERNRLNNIIRILKPDLVYLLVSFAVMVCGIAYFLIVK